MKKFFLFPIVLLLLVSTACGFPASVTEIIKQGPSDMAPNLQQIYPHP